MGTPREPSNVLVFFLDSPLDVIMTSSPLQDLSGVERYCVHMASCGGMLYVRSS